MSADFSDLEESKERLFHALHDRFDAIGIVVFDEQLNVKPRLTGEDLKPWWGGYELRFKLIDRKKHENLKGQPEKLRINAIVTGFEQDRTFTVDFSKYEYTEPQIARSFSMTIISGM